MVIKMDTYLLHNLISQYLPGFGYLLLLLLAHVFIATWYHIKVKDFSFTCWPNYMGNFLGYILFILIVNGAAAFFQDNISNPFITNGILTIRAAAYFQIIAYYIANIVEHLCLLNNPIAIAIKDFVLNALNGIKNSLFKKGDGQG